jgi:hypothetical protein
MWYIVMMVVIFVAILVGVWAGTSMDSYLDKNPDA